MGTSRGKKQAKSSSVKPQHVCGDRRRQRLGKTGQQAAESPHLLHQEQQGCERTASEGQVECWNNGKEEAPSSAPPSLDIERLQRDIEIHQAKAKAKKMKATRTSFKDPGTWALMGDCIRHWFAKSKEEKVRKGEKVHHMEKHARLMTTATM